MTDATLLKLLGERLAAIRLQQNKTQHQVAAEAGLGLRTLQRIEQGATATQLTGFLRLCRVLGLLQNIETFIPETSPSPMMMLRLAGKQRQRARNVSESKGSNQPWTWGDAE